MPGLSLRGLDLGEDGSAWSVQWNADGTQRTATHHPTGVRLWVSRSGWMTVVDDPPVTAKLIVELGEEGASRLLRSLMSEAALLPGIRDAVTPATMPDQRVMH